MHPIERLRYVARTAGADPGALAAEAAEALADLAFEPRALVLACKRLLDAQAGNGPLWWVAAHVLAAPDPVVAARRCASQLVGDLSGLELAYALPSGATVAVEAAGLVAGALLDRPDCSLRVFGAPHELRFVLADLAEGAAGGPAAVGYGFDELDEGLEGVSIVLVAARAASPAAVLVEPGAAELVRAASLRGAAVWLVAGIGCVLPEAIFAACAASSPPEEVVAAGSIARVVSPGGLVEPGVGLDPGECPSPASLAAGPARR